MLNYLLIANTPDTTASGVLTLQPKIAYSSNTSQFSRIFCRFTIS